MVKDQKEHITSIGGSAVMEGVMMKGPREIAKAVRKSDGEIRRFEFCGWKQKKWTYLYNE